MGKSLLIVKNIAHEGPGLLETELQRSSVITETVDLSTGCHFPDPLAYDALIILGGPQSANDTTKQMQQEIEQANRALQAGLPVLGICLGLQVLVKAGGGSVVESPVRETGFFDHEGEPFLVELTDEGRKDPLFGNMNRTFRVFQLHGETVKLAAGMQLLARGKHCINQAVRIGSNAYGLQCHFELTPAMLSEWCRLDRDLGKMDGAELARQFEAVRKEYTATGLLVMHNFLHIAGIL
ncbi:MAG: type 1 glutamine amidotransferase [Chlorobium sp.]|uniref:type 1 glutamine amidotransferase n=1 Tax=Chlorobium sp. TaxID=1095 RepID=UPI0025C48AF9|nr:type 1 glutamine amidotransferase [Chlorobium sp.]MCF8384005.1 type 1 glutamine amidotransferase [Chlorobium sp.]